jgi:hypothetical protein
MGRVSSLKELKQSVLDTTRQTEAQIGSLVSDYINLTLSEISDPGWAFGQQNFTHLWSFLRRKTTITTVASTEDYVLKRDIDRISLCRQTTSPAIIRALSDKNFYNYVPDPTATGNPRYYRIWENEGVSTRLTTAGTINVVSSSTSDAGSSTLTVTVWGYDANGSKVSETFALNGTTSVVGTTTFAVGPIFVSKQSDTTGNITVSSGVVNLVVIGKEERNPKFKVISFYPIPSSAITIYIEYYSRMRMLKNDGDCPEFDEKWHWVVRQGTLAKVYQYLNKETDFAANQAIYASGVRSMVSADLVECDLISHLNPRQGTLPLIMLQQDDIVTS